MPIDNHLLRRDLFKAGTRYAVKSLIRQGPGERFEAGELLTFVSAGYSHYDGEFAYEFEDTHGRGRMWCLHDSQPIELAASLFTEVREASAQKRELFGNEALAYAKEHLREVRTDSHLRETEFENPHTQERWILDYPHGELQGGGEPRLRKIPSPWRRDDLPM